MRVEPVDTLRPAGAAGLRSGWSPWVRRLGARGDSLRRMPLRNVFRTPRRSVLTSLAIATSIATLLGVVGLLDSVLATIDRGEREVLADVADRVIVDMAGYELTGSPTLRAVTESAALRDAEPFLRIGGRLGSGPAAFDTLVVAAPLDSPLWRPTATEGSFDHDEPGLVVSRKAATDLGLEVGSTVRLRHPYREGIGYRWVETDLPVHAIHGNPLRPLVYVDLADASIFNLEGIFNAVQARPAPGLSVEAVKRRLFDVEGVGAVDGVASITDGLRSVIDRSVGILDVVRFAVLVLALLIAYNSSSIGADERAREHATMFAFGVPIRRVLAISVSESLIIGLGGTVVGLAAGYGLLRWLVGVVVPDTFPDISVAVALRPATVLTAAVVGTAAVALAPLLTVRRLRRMDLPATLRVVE